MKKYLSAPLLFVCLLFSVTPISAKNIYYVSDNLTIPMRSGTTNGHKILKFLSSGDALEVVETTDDEKHALVMPINDESKTGWVETKLLMKTKSARDQLEVAKKKIQSMKEKQSGIKKQLLESQTQNGELQTVQARLQTKIKNLQNTLARLRKNASDPIRIADENEQLQQQLASAQKQAEELTQENIILGDQNIKSWFLIGAAVSIGSLMLGIVLTRIRWKKNDRWA